MYLKYYECSNYGDRGVLLQLIAVCNKALSLPTTVGYNDQHCKC